MRCGTTSISTAISCAKRGRGAQPREQPAKQSVRSILLYRMAVFLSKTAASAPRGGHLMRKILIGVAAAALLAGCTTDPQPRYYQAGYPPPPPPAPRI